MTSLAHLCGRKVLVKIKRNTSPSAAEADHIGQPEPVGAMKLYIHEYPQRERSVTDFQSLCRAKKFREWPAKTRGLESGGLV